MNKLRLYIKESFDELIYKVTWPTWPELQSTTVLVIIASVIIALVIWVMDLASNSALGSFYDLIGS